MLSEDELIRLMRETREMNVVDRIGSTGDTVTVSQPDPLFSAGGNTARTMNRSELNVQWSTYEGNLGGLDSLFGFDDEDEVMW